MSDAFVPLNPQRVMFFASPEDKKWSQVTPDSFIRSTSIDLVEDDPYMLFTPEKLSIRRFMRQWSQAGVNDLRMLSYYGFVQMESHLAEQKK